VVEEGGRSHRLREVAPEGLQPDVAALLRAALAPLDDAALARLAAEREWTLDAVDAFVSDLVADGVLLRG
jgi:hypothetical protein